MTPDHDPIRAAFAPARRLEPTDADVLRVVARLPRPRASTTRRTLALAALGLLVVAGAASAATGLVPVGSVLSGDGFEGDPRPAVSETVVAAGDDATVGEWRITTFRAPKGAECMKLEADGDAQAPGDEASGYCGYLEGLNAFSHGSSAVAERRGRVVLFGHAPADAAAIELTAASGTVARVETQGGATDRYWLLSAPLRLQRPQLRWLDASGRPAGEPLDVTYRFTGRVPRAVVMTGVSPYAGRWRLEAYESERKSVGGDIYEPEGLPCQTVFLGDPRANGPSGSGGCGALANAPGFTRHQMTLPATPGTPPKEVLVFGSAPREADAVELVSGDRLAQVVETRPAPPGGASSSYWLMTVGPGDVTDAVVRWVDRDRDVRGPSVAVHPR